MQAQADAWSKLDKIHEEEIRARGALLALQQARQALLVQGQRNTAALAIVEHLTEQYEQVESGLRDEWAETYYRLSTAQLN